VADPEVPSGKWITVGAIAKAFDIPPELIAPDCVNQTPGWAAAPELPVYQKQPLSTHASGLALDVNWPDDLLAAPEHIHFDPEPGAMYFEGDGDVDSVPKNYLLAFDVIGAPQPEILSSLPELVWENDLGKIVQKGNYCAVSLRGKVHVPGKGWFELGAAIVVTNPELAQQLIGVIPNDGPGTGMCFLEESAGGQLFTWEAGTGWIPKPVYAPLHASFPEVSTTKGGVKFGYGAAEEPLFDPTEAPYGWFCTVCEEHMIVHKGDPVACDSAGSVRPATSAEHKLAVLTGGTPS
jgi:hypothetical protein